MLGYFLVNKDVVAVTVAVVIAVVGAAAAVVDVATAVANDDAVGAVVPPSLTEDKGAYASQSEALEGTCVSVFADGAGQHGEDDEDKSAAGEVGHENRSPRRFNHCGRGDRRRRVECPGGLLLIPSSPRSKHCGEGQTRACADSTYNTYTHSASRAGCTMMCMR